MTIPQNSDSDRLERIERLVEKIANDQIEMKAAIAALTLNMAALQQAVGRLQLTVSALQRDMGVVQRDMGVMKGWQTELVVERRARAFSGGCAAGISSEYIPILSCATI